MKFPSPPLLWKAGENFVVTPDYCRGILEAEALFRVLVTAFAAALVTTLGLAIAKTGAGVGASASSYTISIDYINPAAHVCRAELDDRLWKRESMCYFAQANNAAKY